MGRPRLQGVVSFQVYGAFANMMKPVRYVPPREVPTGCLVCPLLFPHPPRHLGVSVKSGTREARLIAPRAAVRPRPLNHLEVPTLSLRPAATLYPRVRVAMAGGVTLSACIHPR